MKSPALENIRNIGIISHIDAGKTTVSERMLYYTGEIHRMGEVHDGSATMDWMDQEQERGITITATSTAFRWHDLWINLIDTPGHIDFTIEVERSLRVLDGAVAIFSAVEGVQPQSESVWHQADRYHVPRICFINKMDRIGADFGAVLQSIEERLKARPIPLQLPVGAESEFNAIIDVLGEQLLTFSDDDLGSSVLPRPLPEELREQRNQALEKIVEAAADYDDSILQDFLEGKPISREQLIPALRKGVHACEIFPVLVGSALRNKGVQPLLDAVGDFLPSPLDLPPVQAHRLVEDAPQELAIPCDPKGPLVALAFKVVSDEGRKLTYLRIYSGRLEPGMDLHNPRLEKPEKIARLFRMHAHKRERLHEALAGDIVAAAGLKDALTGDTLSAVDFPVTLAGLTVPEPVVSLAVEPKGVDDREKLLPSLEKLQWEDPTFRVREDAETGQTILTGMGELHLEVVINRLEREFHVQTTTGKPQVVYRETLNKQISRQEIFEREVDGRLQRGEVHLELTPLERGSGIHILLPDPETCALPEVLQMLLRQSLEQACAAGVKTGYPLTDLQVRVVKVPYDPATTTEMGLRAAAQRGLAMAARDAAPTLLEPIMSLELIVPSESSGKVLGSLQQKRGRVEGMLSRGELEVIKAQVALSEMFGYMTELRSATRGRGTFTMEFSHFDQAPQETLQRFGF